MGLPRNDEPKHDAAYKLFNYNFQIRVAQAALRASNSRGGRHNSKNIEKVIAEGGSLQNVNVTPARIAYLVTNGWPVLFIKPTDAITVYNIYAQHLKDWRDHVMANINVKTPPIKDLEMLQQAMTYIYPTVRNQRAVLILTEEQQELQGLEAYLYGRSGRVSYSQDRIEQIKDQKTDEATFVDEINRLGFSRGTIWNK